jgi:hypothetical protein
MTIHLLVLFFTALASVHLQLLHSWRFTFLHHLSCWICPLSYNTSVIFIFYHHDMCFDELIPFATWDNDLDSETLVTLAIWYRSHDTFLCTFDWVHYLDPHAFEIYACTPTAEAAILLGAPFIIPLTPSLYLVVLLLLLGHHLILWFCYLCLHYSPSCLSCNVSPPLLLAAAPAPPLHAAPTPALATPTPAPAHHHITCIEAEFITSTSDARKLALSSLLPPSWDMWHSLLQYSTTNTRTVLIQLVGSWQCPCHHLSRQSPATVSPHPISYLGFHSIFHGLCIHFFFSLKLLTYFFGV